MKSTQQTVLRRALGMVVALAVLLVVMCGLPALAIHLFGDPSDLDQRAWFATGGCVASGLLTFWLRRHRQSRQTAASTAHP